MKLIQSADTRLIPRPSSSVDISTVWMAIKLILRDREHRQNGFRTHSLHLIARVPFVPMVEQRLLSHLWGRRGCCTRKKNKKRHSQQSLGPNIKSDATKKKILFHTSSGATSYIQVNNKPTLLCTACSHVYEASP